MKIIRTFKLQKIKRTDSFSLKIKKEVQRNKAQKRNNEDIRVTLEFYPISAPKNVKKFFFQLKTFSTA